MELVSVAVGGQIGYTTGDPLLLLDDLKVLQPHFMPSVPRVLNRLYQSAMSAGTAPGIKGALFRKAVATKLHNMRQNGQFTHAFYDRLVFKKVPLMCVACTGHRMLNVTGSNSFTTSSAEGYA